MSLSTKNKWNRKTSLWIIILAGADLLSKYVIFERGLEVPFIHPVINGFGAWSLPIATRILVAASIIITILLVVLYRKNYMSHRSFIFLFSGALGNLYDRLIFEGVRDRIQIGEFPVFNIADILITIGVLLLIMEYRKQSRA